MIVQPYVINNSKGKKVEMYRLPRVYDGSQYYLTQDRRMGYDITRDSLDAFIIENEPLSAEKASYMWNDTIKLSNAQDNFQVLALMQMEDYTRPYYERLLELSTRSPSVRYVSSNIRSTSMKLDPKKYEEKPKVDAVPVWKTFL